MLEASQYKDNCFVTLTYDDDNLPSDGSLDRRHLQLFMKSFRASIAPLKVRFYGVGEYGERTQRPHYHLALFGWPSCQARSGDDRSSFVRICCDCFACSRVRKAWLRGGVVLGSLSVESAQYVAGYVTKKMTNANDPLVASWLKGRSPEFCQMSRRPGIGVNAMFDVASEWMRFNLDASESDVPVTLRHGSRKLPLGRFLRSKLREFAGVEVSSDSARQDVFERLQHLLEAAKDSSDDPSFRSHVIKAGDQKVRNMQSRLDVHKKEKKL